MTSNPLVSNLFFNTKGFILGLRTLSYSVGISPLFDPEDLSPVLRDNFFNNTKFVVFQTSIVRTSELDQERLLIPEWIHKFKRIHSLHLRQVKVGRLNSLKNHAIKHLIFNEAVFEEKASLIADVAAFAHLEYLAHTSSFTDGQIDALKKKKPRLKVYSYSEYNRKVESGEIRITR
jgi:hypothetical protein